MRSLNSSTTTSTLESAKERKNAATGPAMAEEGRLETGLVSGCSTLVAAINGIDKHTQPSHSVLDGGAGNAVSRWPEGTFRMKSEFGGAAALAAATECLRRRAGADRGRDLTARSSPRPEVSPKTRGK